MEFTVPELQKIIPPAVNLFLTLNGWEIKNLPLGRPITHAIDRVPDCRGAIDPGDWVEFQQTQGDIRDVVYRAHIPSWVLLRMFFISILPWYRSTYDLKRQKTRDNARFSFKLRAHFKSVELKDCKVVNERGIWKVLPKTAGQIT